MDLMWAAILGVAGVVGAIILAVVPGELAAWRPRLTETLIDRAVRNLPKEKRERYAEEWRAYVNDIPGDVGKIVAAFSLLKASRAMNLRLPSLTYLFSKRALDVAFGACLITLLSPWLLIISLGILLESGRPILYRQKRKGFDGRTFEILKFRTMDVCEDKKSFAQAKKGDARITPFGHFMRRLSVDELPQLWNIVRGDMSLVGPRPHPLALDNRYDGMIAGYAERYQVKPGLTGWAQINGARGEAPTIERMHDRVVFDLWYIQNRSVLLDLKILFRTAFITPFDQ